MDFSNLALQGDDVSHVEWALAYARASMPVFPCRPGDKEPLTGDGGFHHATTDAAIIRSWWSLFGFAEMGWAINLGLAAIDLDTKSGRNGVRGFRKRQGCDPLDLETPIATTPTGGLHLIVKANGRDLAQISAGELADDGIDTRVGGKGYLILPGPRNGRRWIKSLATTPIMDAPAWLPEKRDDAPKPGECKPFTGIASRRASQTLGRACSALANAPPGVRDATIARHVYWLGRLAGAGEIDSGATLDALIAAMAACHEGDPRKVRANLDKVRRCFSDGLSKPAEAPDAGLSDAQKTAFEKARGIVRGTFYSKLPRAAIAIRAATAIECERDPAVRRALGNVVAAHLARHGWPDATIASALSLASQRRIERLPDWVGKFKSAAP